HREPFAVMSAYLDPASERLLAGDPGVTAILRKPFDIAHLLRDVRAVLRRATGAAFDAAPAAASAPSFALAPLWLVRPQFPHVPQPPPAHGTARAASPARRVAAVRPAEQRAAGAA